MKKFILIFILFLAFMFTIDLVRSDCSPFTPCCCQEYPGGERKCFTSGICCLSGIQEYWDPLSCFDFRIWAEPEQSMFTVGKQTRINLYIRNTGSFTDGYDITSLIIGNPSLIKVDMSGVSVVSDVARGEIRLVYPRITVLASSASGKVVFNATSQGDQRRYRNATLSIISSDMPVSLPEFEFFGIIVIIILAIFIFSIFKKFS